MKTFNTIFFKDFHTYINVEDRIHHTGSCKRTLSQLTSYKKVSIYFPSLLQKCPIRTGLKWKETVWETPWSDVTQSEGVWCVQLQSCCVFSLTLMSLFFYQPIIQSLNKHTHMGPNDNTGSHLWASVCVCALKSPKVNTVFQHSSVTSFSFSFSTGCLHIKTNPKCICISFAINPKSSLEKY